MRQPERGLGGDALPLGVSLARLPTRRPLVLEILQQRDGVSVTLRPFPVWSKFWVPAGVVVLAVSLMLAAHAWAPSRIVELALPTLLALAVAAAYGAILAMVWHTAGREVVTVASGRLTIEHFTWRRVRHRSFSAFALEIRSVPAGPVMQQGRQVHGSPCLAFDQDGKTVRFGAGLEGAEATRVLNALSGALKHQGPGASVARGLSS